ncbi:MAG: ABC transporter permease [Actinobacteria bacterium]|nr:ABC transporter permease [Actinomycetota bacterium]
MTTRYLLRRLAQLPPSALLILTATWLLLHLAPGDPLVALAGQYGDEAYYAAMRERFGLDQPLPQQLATYLGNVLRGDLGTSYVRGRPALSVVLERLPATLLLASTALLVSTTVGVALGVLAARRGGGRTDVSLRVTTLTLYAMPAFWVAQLAVLVLAYRLGWFPIHGMTDARRSLSGLAAAGDVLHHLLLPAAVLAAGELALNVRLVRTGLLEASRSDYIRTARAKGAPGHRVLYHALRNALLPVVTVLGNRIGMFFTGAVLVEVVFAWPGVGRLLLTSAQSRDLPVLLAIFLIVAGAVLVVNLLVDILYTWLDPRISYAAHD